MRETRTKVSSNWTVRFHIKCEFRFLEFSSNHQKSHARLFFREAQLEIKKWEIKEAEKQRVVKINAAEWVDHPDRYLLELAGRPVYNNTAS